MAKGTVGVRKAPPRPVLILQNSDYGRRQATDSVHYARGLGCALLPVRVNSWSDLLGAARTVDACFAVVDPFFRENECPDLGPLQELSALSSQPDVVLCYPPRGRPHPESLGLPRVEFGAVLLQGRSDSPEDFLRALALAARHRWRSGIWAALTSELTEADLAALAWAVRGAVLRFGHATFARVRQFDGPSRQHAGRRCRAEGLSHPKRVIDAYHASLWHAAASADCLSRSAISVAMGFRTGDPLSRIEEVMEVAVARPGAAPVESDTFWVDLIREARREEEGARGRLRGRRRGDSPR